MFELLELLGYIRIIYQAKQIESNIVKIKVDSTQIKVHLWNFNNDLFLIKISFILKKKLKLISQR